MFPSLRGLLEQGVHQIGNQIKLVEIKLVPWNRGIGLQRRLELFACRINRCIDFFQLAAISVLHDLRPSLIGLSQGNGVGMTRAAIAAEGFVRLFSHVRSSHYDRNPGGANSISHAVRLGNHPGHCADTNQPDVLVPDELHNLSLVHGLGIAIDQQNFMSGRSERLE
jgi:hypothetical protein